jgi:hypothetical protein
MITISMIAVLTAIALPSYSYLIRGSRSPMKQRFPHRAEPCEERGDHAQPQRHDLRGRHHGRRPPGCLWHFDRLSRLDGFRRRRGQAFGSYPVAIEPERIVRTWVRQYAQHAVAGRGVPLIRFNNRGQSNIADKLTFTLMPSSDCSNQQKREIVVNSLGRSGSSKVDCS